MEVPTAVLTPPPGAMAVTEAMVAIGDIHQMDPIKIIVQKEINKITPKII